MSDFAAAQGVNDAMSDGRKRNRILERCLRSNAEAAGRFRIENDTRDEAERVVRAPSFSPATVRSGEVVGNSWNPSFSDLARIGQVIEKDGGRDRDRTCDPYHVKVVLSR